MYITDKNKGFVIGFESEANYKEEILILEKLTERMGPYEEKFTEILKRFEGNKEVHFSNAEMREFFMCMTYCSMYLIEIICEYNELLDAHRELNDAATETIDTQVKTINALQMKYDKLGMALHTQNFILGVLMEKNNIRVESDSMNLTS